MKYMLYLQHQANMLSGGEHDASYFSHIASLSVIPANQSRQICLVCSLLSQFLIFSYKCVSGLSDLIVLLWKFARSNLIVPCLILQVAVTSKGVRLYFSVYPPSQLQQYNQQQAGYTQASQTFVSFWFPLLFSNHVHLHFHCFLQVSQADARPQCIRMVHVRFTPGVCPSSVYRDAPDGVYVSYTDNCQLYFVCGTLFMCAVDVCTLCCLTMTDSGTSVMATSNRNVVWAVSNLFHPNNAYFTENMVGIHCGCPVNSRFVCVIDCHQKHIYF